MAKNKTVTTTEAYAWDAEKGDWIPTDKQVKTVETDDSVLGTPPWSTSPSQPYDYRPYFDRHPWQSAPVVTYGAAGVAHNVD